jgi:hypothetical protein
VILDGKQIAEVVFENSDTALLSINGGIKK